MVTQTHLRERVAEDLDINFYRGRPMEFYIVRLKIRSGLLPLVVWTASIQVFLGLFLASVVQFANGAFPPRTS